MLLLVAIIVVAVVWLEGGRPEGDLLDQMARRSLPLEQALATAGPPWSSSMPTGVSPAEPWLLAWSKWWNSIPRSIWFC